MARGSKRTYTNKQKRKAEHIADGYERRGISDREAERRAWATVNAEDGGGKKSGSGRGKPKSPRASRSSSKGARRTRRPAAKSTSARKSRPARKRRAAR